MGNALGGALRAVRGAKRVVHVHFRHGGELLGEFRVVLGFGLVETHVFQHHHGAVRKLRGKPLRVGADDVLGELHFHAQQLA